MNNCKRCKSVRVAYISGKCSDLCSFTAQLAEGIEVEGDGYTPQGVGLVNEYGDYVEFEYCLDCGQIQGEFPVKDAAVHKAIKGM